MNKTLTISGMTCHKDRAHAKTLLESFEGVSNVSISGDTASLDYTEKTDFDQVTQVLESLGFRVQ